MQKKEFAKKVAEKSGMKIVDAERMITAFVDVVTEAFNNDERIELRGFGNFVKKNKKAHKGRNMRTGSIIDIPAKSVLTFKASPLFNKTKE